MLARNWKVRFKGSCCMQLNVERVKEEMHTKNYADQSINVKERSN
jgi:hypothetical protein